ncbi:HNH endonuclease signature motif containing protein [Vibrio sp. 818]|nr:HNH endonuclease signature motif containing protein [Vibrio sp. 818]
MFHKLNWCSMKNDVYKEIVGDDKQYLNWLAQNPDGYVVNCLTTKDDYRVLHRSDCRSINTLISSASEGGFTERKYIKVCASTIEGLKKWSVDNGAKEQCFSSICMHCMKKDQQQQELEKFAQLVAEASKVNASTRIDKLNSYDGVATSKVVETTVYSRSPEVVAETLERANGVCEECGEDAPFNRKSDGSPYLEVHHVIPLSQSGLDLLSNTIALCPNCHRKAHFG